MRTRVGQGTFVAEGAASAGRERLGRSVDAAIDRLLVDACTAGISLDELGGRLARRIERFKRDDSPGWLVLPSSLHQLVSRDGLHRTETCLP